MKTTPDPNKCFVNLTYKCNNRCISCIMPARNLQGDKSSSEIKSEIDKILKISDHIEFNGGEPTLRRDLFKILKYVSTKNRNAEITLITNARAFASPSFINKLESLNLKNFKIATTLYGNNSKIHDGITRTPNSFEQKIQALTNLIKAQIKIELRIVVNKLNYKYLNDISKFITKNFSNNNFICINIIAMKIYGEAHKNRTIGTIRISDTIPYLDEAVNNLSKKNFIVSLSHFPHCILPNTLWDLSRGISAEKTEVGFIQGCSNCLVRKDCSGIWRSYLQMFGSNEFKKTTNNNFRISKKEIKKRIQKIDLAEDPHAADILLFLMDLKKVLRIEERNYQKFLEVNLKKETKNLNLIEDFPFITDRKNNRLYFSKDLNLALRAKKITNELQLIHDKKQILNYNNELAELYGYPSCCGEKFDSHPEKFNENYLNPKTQIHDKLPPIRLSHLPCSANCIGTKKLVSNIKKRIQELKNDN